MIAIVDYGAGNIFSVKNALDYDIGAHLVDDDQVSIDLKLSHNGTDRDSLDAVTEYSE